MTALLTDNLPLLAGAPNGIQKLRELILELAVRGKLVPQDPSDEPASELLKRIAEEKARLVAEGKIKKQKPLAGISDEEKPYDIPGNWEWVRLPEIYYPVSVSGNKLLSSQIVDEGDFPVVDQGKRFVAGYTDDESLLIRLPGPVVVFGDHTTERKYVDFDFVAGADGVKILRPVLQDERFFWWQLVGLKLEGRGYARHFKVLNDAFFALPPKSEQSRIVAKVDELMALCDRLETRQADAESAHARLVQALLDSLTQASDADDFAASWQRLAKHFHSLFTSESSIDALKQTLLQLAVMGKLVLQDPSDEPASELLKRIAEEKARLMAEGKLSKQKASLDLAREEMPYELPGGWCWSTLPAIGELARGKSRHRPRNDPALYVGGDIPLVQTGDVARANGVINTYTALYNEVGLEQSRLWPEGTMCITIAANIADSATLGFDACFPDSVVGFVPYLEEIDVRYFEFFLRTAKSHLEDFAPSTAQKNINLEILSCLSVPLPPVAEANRIVARLDQLLSLCDQLKARLTAASQLNERLAGALVEQAVA